LICKTAANLPPQTFSVCNHISCPLWHSSDSILPIQSRAGFTAHLYVDDGQRVQYGCTHASTSRGGRSFVPSACSRRYPFGLAKFESLHGSSLNPTIRRCTWHRLVFALTRPLSAIRDCTVPASMAAANGTSFRVRERRRGSANTPSLTPIHTASGSPLSMTPSGSLSGVSTPVGAQAQVCIISIPVCEPG
jgi:hypothetical protein